MSSHVLRGMRYLGTLTNCAVSEAQEETQHRWRQNSATQWAVSGTQLPVVERMCVSDPSEQNHPWDMARGGCYWLGSNSQGLRGGVGFETRIRCAGPELDPHELSSTSFLLGGEWTKRGC